jgi:YHS domain-containing protein
MRLCPRGSQLHENHFAPQPLEITPFRLTPPFRLAYTDFIAPEGDFQRSPGNTNICMSFLARFVRFLFWLLVASWAAWLLRSFVGWMLRNATTGGQTSTEASTPMDGRQLGRRLVRDPICGMHVDETLSIPFRNEGELLHFCSPACRDAYAESTKKFAANG